MVTASDCDDGDAGLGARATDGDCDGVVTDCDEDEGGARFSCECAGVPGCLVAIPAGTFTMGSPAEEAGRLSAETEHQVTLTRGFYLAAEEVTQGEWEALMGNRPSYFSACGDDCPVEKVSWWEALAYANARSDA